MEFAAIVTTLVVLGVADGVLQTINTYYYTTTYAQFFNQATGCVKQCAVILGAPYACLAHWVVDG